MNDPVQSGSIDRGYLLAELRCASLRAKLLQLDIEAVGIALKAGAISSSQAIYLLRDCDALRLVGTEHGVPHEARN